MAYQFLEYEVQNGIASLRLNRPPVNALGRQLVAELTAAARQINSDLTSRDIRVVVLSSAGRHFCAGADLKERLATPEEEVEGVVQALRGAVQAVADLEVPSIAAVHGSALGGGMELALAADMRVLSDTAILGLRETALAIIPGAGGTQRLPRLIGYAAAMEWIATARTFTAAECLAQGLANRVVPEAELHATAMQLAGMIAANGPLAVRAAKEAMRRGGDMPLREGLAYEMECYRRIIPTRDRREALQAFSEKRPPVFKGE
ncbi:MAG: enoyl-CoA hydratase-related protein [candidate division KSB1 bacterium]|nr:enoyl-CoA hydratase-related protein [candidate division KSB1 bacterium]MDZ7275114.1 enoyl-CoA hydratase-related protein [candidate division KSB1 bacterium]MDZ7286438.1 enoyl-CoA hydratase-related protein [candidate division KSB1 bacterium]MDZ7299398.1 enoyl-CoA hydratase-related protein [candidate division KSB1 bacterium]MDZ7307824.1 enoyl-CoA hydratase-related protein [candidate division KSB1 bacterium]